MIRNIMGCLIMVGTGVQPADWVRVVREARDRKVAAPTFSADGLYFMGPRYDPELELARARAGHGLVAGLISGFADQGWAAERFFATIQIFDTDGSPLALASWMSPSSVHRTRIKICGLTREANVDAAVEAGADAIGLVLYEKSPRYVDAVRAGVLARRLPPFVTPVVLLVNASPSLVQAALDAVPMPCCSFMVMRRPPSAKWWGGPMSALPAWRPVSIRVDFHPVVRFRPGHVGRCPCRGLWRRRAGL